MAATGIITHPRQQQGSPPSHPPYLLKASHPPQDMGTVTDPSSQLSGPCPRPRAGMAEPGLGAT